jgi:serine/threonine-protein kinase HipA
MHNAIPKWKELLEISFLSDDMKEKYLGLFEGRIKKFF